MALAVLDDNRSVAAVAAANGCTWNTCHRAVEVTADPLLDTEPEPITVLGIDETRRGKAKYEMCPDTGTRVWVDRFDTGLVDISGEPACWCRSTGGRRNRCRTGSVHAMPGGGSRSRTWRSTCR
jgi:hypothetical protein